MKELGARIIRGKKPVYGPSTSSDVLRYIYRGTTAPTVAQGVRIGDIWSDTTANITKRCSATSPVTFVSISEVGTPGAHATSHTNGTDDIQDASVSVKGIAQFNTQYFTVASGVVSTNLDNTPVDAELTEGITSNWAYQHNANANAHHTIYPGAGEQAFLDADHAKLDGIAANATKYPDTGEQAFLDADHTKLDGIATGATNYADANASAAVNASGVALASGMGVVFQTILASDNTYSGVLANCQAGENFTIGQAGYEKSDGLVWLALANSVNTMPSAFLATGAITVNTNGLFLAQGAMRCDNVFTFNPGNILYISNSTGGSVTNTRPAATGDQVQVMGLCKYNANTILWNPSYELVEI